MSQTNVYSFSVAAEKKKKEQEAARVIAEYAYRIFEKNPQQVHFQIQSQHLSIDVKIFELPRSSLRPST